MATSFVPLQLDLIDEGVFAQDIDQALADLQDKIARFRKQHGLKSAKAKGKLQIDLEVAIEGDGEEDTFSIKASMKTTLPKAPASVSLAMGGETEDGRMGLFVRKSGSDSSHPEQMKLSTQDGRTITDGEPAE